MSKETHSEFLEEMKEKLRRPTLQERTKDALSELDEGDSK